MEELRKEPVTAGLILLNILVFLISGIYRKLPEYHAYAGLWSCLYTNDHSGWRILQTVHLYVSAFWN